LIVDQGGGWVSKQYACVEYGDVWDCYKWIRRAISIDLSRSDLVGDVWEKSTRYA